VKFCMLINKLTFHSLVVRKFLLLLNSVVSNCSFFLMHYAAHNLRKQGVSYTCMLDLTLHVMFHCFLSDIVEIFH